MLDSIIDAMADSQTRMLWIWIGRFTPNVTCFAEYEYSTRISAGSFHTQKVPRPRFQGSDQSPSDYVARKESSDEGMEILHKRIGLSF
jgi:hypothetical protein